VTFVDILEEILDSSDRRCNLDIDMTIVLLEKIRIVGHNVCIREYMAMLVNSDDIVTSSIDWVSIYVR